MSEEPTDRLNGENTFEARVLAGLAAINNRLTTELGAINGRLTSIENRLTSLEDRMTSLEGRVSAMDGRLTTLEEKVDARLRETRPIWEAVLSRLDMIDSKLNVIWKDMLTMRGEVDMLKERVLPPTA